MGTEVSLTILNFGLLESMTSEPGFFGRAMNPVPHFVPFFLSTNALSENRHSRPTGHCPPEKKSGSSVSVPIFAKGNGWNSSVESLPPWFVVQCEHVMKPLMPARIARNPSVQTKQLTASQSNVICVPPTTGL